MNDLDEERDRDRSIKDKESNQSFSLFSHQESPIDAPSTAAHHIRRRLMNCEDPYGLRPSQLGVITSAKV